MAQSDLIALEEVSEKSILECLKERLLAGEPYTGLGSSVVVKVNPFGTIKKRPVNEGPHVARLAQIARSRAIRTGKSQSCMMTGESGSGKTEATKVFLAELADAKHCTNQALHIQLVDSCTLLESFGNCATEHNHNSSRFARWFALDIDKHTGKVESGLLRQYLLEKARVVQSSANSSSFHVFYDLCASFEDSVDPTAMEQGQAYFRFLKDRPAKGSEIRWERMQAQLARLSIDEDSIASVENLLWCILHLGNLDFSPSESDSDHCIVEEGSTQSLKCISELLGFKDVATTAALFCQKQLEIGREKVIQQRTAPQAKEAANALATDMYSRLFQWVINSVNSRIHVPLLNPSDTSRTSVGLLDIFGFERLTHNSFEQLCINYCNEKLVAQFHNVLVEAEVAVCSAEGIAREDVGLETAYEKEQARKQLVLDGIDRAFAVIQDETRLPKATDLSLTRKLHQLGLCHETKDTRLGKPIFPVLHYAGQVDYDVEGFLTKNRDEGPVDLIKVLATDCSVQFIKDLFKDVVGSQDVAPKGKGKGKKAALGIQFRDEFSSLAAALASSDQQFVMCVKPNRRGAQDCFEEDLVLKQLECNGLLAVCQVRKSAFAAHLPHKEFISDFGMLATGSFKSIKDPRTQADTILKQFLEQQWFDPSEAFLGKSKVLLRQAALVSLRIHQRSIIKLVCKAQAVFRGIPFYRRWQATRKAVLTMQRVLRGAHARAQASSLRAQNTKAIQIQTVARAFLARRRAKQIKAVWTMQRKITAAILLQSVARMQAATKRVASLVLAKENEFIEREKAASLIQRIFRGSRARRAAAREQKLAALRAASRKREHLATLRLQIFARRVLLHKRLQRRIGELSDERAVLLRRSVNSKEETGVLGPQRKCESSEGTEQAPVEELVHIQLERPTIPENSRKPPSVSTPSDHSSEDARKTGDMNSQVNREPPSPTNSLTSVKTSVAQASQGRGEEEPRVITEPEDEDGRVEAGTSPPGDKRALSTDKGGSQKRVVKPHPILLKVQRTVRGWLARRRVNQKKHEAWLAKHSQEKQAEARILADCMFAQKSATFLRKFGKTEEAHYAEVVKRSPEYQFMHLERSHVVPLGDGRKIEAEQARARKALEAAVSQREFLALCDALRQAYQSQYSGPEVSTAEAIVGHLRKIHMKQLEAEQALVEKFQLNVANSPGVR